jgi:hypothetical protein
MKTLIEMLEKCRLQFLEYERQHRAKGTAESDVKADVNAALAAECREVAATYILEFQADAAAKNAAYEAHRKAYRAANPVRDKSACE